TQIRDLIDRANHAYHNSGVAILGDATYDALKEELETLAPSDPRLSQVGAPLPRGSIREKRRHAIPMGSQDKRNSKEGFLGFVSARGLAADALFHANLKVDGASCALEYVGGSLFRALTRGKGEYGEDITANALLFANVPKKAFY